MYNIFDFYLYSGYSSNESVKEKRGHVTMKFKIYISYAEHGLLKKCQIYRLITNYRIKNVWIISKYYPSEMKYINIYEVTLTLLLN